MVEHEGNGRWVEIEFDCLPLRSVTRLDVPLDASPVYEQFVLRVKQAIGKHGSHNAYYLHRGKCEFHLTNSQEQGRVAFQFEGTALTEYTHPGVGHACLLNDQYSEYGEKIVPWLKGPQMPKTSFHDWKTAFMQTDNRKKIRQAYRQKVAEMTTTHFDPLNQFAVSDDELDTENIEAEFETNAVDAVDDAENDDIADSE